MSKLRKRLSDAEASALGFKLKKSNDGVNCRYQLEPQEVIKLSQLRTSKEIENNVDNKTSPNDYKKPLVLSAWSNSGVMMSIDEYCEHYKLPRTDISSYKLVSHTGTPFYNIVFKENILDNDIDFSKIKSVLESEIQREYVYKNLPSSRKQEGVLKWADLHFGAHIQNIMHVHDYDKDILHDGLLQSVAESNSLGFNKTHIHIHGDLIESFSGLNHINSWMSMDKELIGANAVKMCSKMLHDVFQKVNNLGCIKIVAGNHDRLSKNNDEDVKGGAAELIAYCLELMGYDVEFHPYVITHVVNDIVHILLHGDKGISKKSTEKIILDYGIQGMYNLIGEAHLHSLIEKLSVKQKEALFVVKDDSILHRRLTLPSFFTGNYYSATLGFTTNAGYFIVWSNSKGKPQFFNGSV
jgi:hypothetical protein